MSETKSLSHSIKIIIAIVAVTVMFVVAFLAINSRDISLNASLKKEWAEYSFYAFDSPRQLSEVMLSNLQGQEKSFLEHQSDWRLVNFGYMFCPDICPINLASLHGLTQLWAENNQRPPLNVMHVTIDPERDTPDLLTQYLNHFNTDFYGLTGSVKNIRRLAQQLNFVFIFEEPDDLGHYFVTHSDSIALINPQGQYVGMFKGPYHETNMLKVLEEATVLLN